MAQLFFRVRNSKNRGIAVATALFLGFLRRKKNKLEWVGYFFPGPLLEMCSLKACLFDGLKYYSLSENQIYPLSISCNDPKGGQKVAQRLI